jgi:hypothetical protein
MSLALPANPRSSEGFGLWRLGSALWYLGFGAPGLWRGVRASVDGGTAHRYCSGMSKGATENPKRDRAELERMLKELGLEPKSYRALMLLPLVYVAWADGKMEHVEIKRIEDFARQRLHFTPETTAVLDNWLKEAPSFRYVERGLEGLLGLALNEDMLAVDVDDLHDLLIHAETIARSTADALDDPNAVTEEEEVALGEIARLLEIDGGSTWKNVLEGLRTHYPRQDAGG